MKRYVCHFIVICIVIQLMSGCLVKASSTAISQREFLHMLKEHLKEESIEDANDEISVFKSCKIVKDNEVALLDKSLTKEMAAVFLFRMDQYLNGNDFDKMQFDIVKKEKRISDLNVATKDNRASIIKVFCKGIMTGYSNGKFSQNRAFKPKTKVTRSEAQIYVNRLLNKKERMKISPDGQLIRLTKLPKNAKRYPYILSSFPNSYYEPKFMFEKMKYGHKPISLVDYAYPKDIGKMTFAYNNSSMQQAMDLYLSQWCDVVKKNMELRFNVDYRTIDSSWVNKLRSTYYVFEDDAKANVRQTDDIKKYVKEMKKNKVVVKAKNVVVERSSLYNGGEDYIRVYVKYKIVKCKSLDGKVVYSDSFDAYDNAKEKWHEKYFDIGIGSKNGYSIGNDYCVSDNRLIEVQ